MVTNNLWIIFEKKLQNLKYKIRALSSSTLDRLSLKRKEIHDLLESIDVCLMDDSSSATLRERRISTQKEITDLDHFSHVDLNRRRRSSGVLREMRVLVIFTVSLIEKVVSWLCMVCLVTGCGWVNWVC